MLSDKSNKIILNFFIFILPHKKGGKFKIKFYLEKILIKWLKNL